ncbi:MAG: CHAT domain-containing protein [Myxococcales bacterium]|nr:CHAT domain-containing protein [Myxococcales bacterium]
MRDAVTASEEAERKVVARIGASAASAPVKASDAQALLPERGALLEFVVRKPLSLHDPKSADSAAVISGCLLVCKGAPVCRDLGKADTIEALAVVLRSAAMTTGGDVDAAGGQLRKLIVDPFATELHAIDHLIIAADGALHLTPFAALPTERGQRLLHKFAVSYLTSGRDLLRMTVQTKPRGPAVMMGDPAYDDQGTAPQQNASVAPRSDVVLAKFAPLPGTAQETKELASL